MSMHPVSAKQKQESVSVSDSSDNVTIQTPKLELLSVLNDGTGEPTQNIFFTHLPHEFVSPEGFGVGNLKKSGNSVIPPLSTS